TARATSTGVAKPTRLLPADAVVIPITLPSEASSAPPDDAVSTWASVWIMSTSVAPGWGVISRPSALTTPDDTSAPTATAGSPTAVPSVVPSTAGVNGPLPSS